jgi:hypothetical protein
MAWRGVDDDVLEPAGEFWQSAVQVWTCVGEKGERELSPMSITHSVADPCESASMSKVRALIPSPAAKCSAVVVFPVPPLRLVIAKRIVKLPNTSGIQIYRHP